MWGLKIFIVGLALATPALSWKDQDKIRLRDVEVLTLREGEWTKGRRSAPVRQLTCNGGSSSGRPHVVQCYNKGWDGRDVQWECKAELEKGVSFGDLSVSCEGYDYPDDPYILAGSCGLEYSLKGGSWYGGGEKESWWGSSYKTAGLLSELTSGFKSLIVLLGAVALLVFFFSTCISPRGGGEERRPPPPPPGFRQDFYPPNDSPFDDGCHRTQGRTYTNTQGRTGGTGGGFWTGAATGGLLGYLFGRNNTGTRAQERYERNYGSSYTSRSYSPPRSSTSTSSNSTYEATGFASTRRR